MTRIDILKQYQTNGFGKIISPGCFEGEMLYVPYFWDAYLNGLADRDNGKTIGFDILDTDKIVFPELRNRRTVKLIQTDQGFIQEVR